MEEGRGAYLGHTVLSRHCSLLCLLHMMLPVYPSPIAQTILNFFLSLAPAPCQVDDGEPLPLLLGSGVGNEGRLLAPMGLPLPPSWLTLS
jgi:hypothetical protein